jgi:hypothetical protein
MQDIIAQDPDTHGSMFVPIILGSDKTTVSVATGHTWKLLHCVGITTTFRLHNIVTLSPYFPLI